MVSSYRTRTSGVGAALLVVCAFAGCVSTPHSTQQAEHSADGNVDRRSMDHHFIAPEDYATVWNADVRDAWQKPEEIVAALALSHGATVADLGAGTGYLIGALREAVGAEGRVVALDAEAAMVAYLEEQVTDEGWDNVEIRHTTHADPSLEPESVHAIVTLDTWHHVAERESFASKLREGLVSGGRFVVVDFIAESTEGFGPPAEMRLSAEEVAAELEAVGFLVQIVEETLPRHYIVVATRCDRYALWGQQ